MKRKMNKKLLSLLILPLMLMPLVSFGYAHWTDKVTKQIKLHAGTVEVEIVQFHVDYCNSYDASCDGIVWIVGDYPIEDDPAYDPDVKYELIIEKLYKTGGTPPHDQLYEIYITADPVFPGWQLEFKMLIHNKGRLTVASEYHRWNWIGPLVDDPCWQETQPYPDDRNVPDCLNATEAGLYEETMWLHDPTITGCPSPCLNKGHYTIPIGETDAVLKPSQCLLLKEVIIFGCQERQAEMQCHWFRLAKELTFKQFVPIEPWSSVSEADQGTSGP